VYWFRLGNEGIDACGGLSVGLLKKPIKNISANAPSKKAEILEVNFAVNSSNTDARKVA
jgi:hypothetical protein